MRPLPRLIAVALLLGLTSVAAIAAEPWPARVGRIGLAETGAWLRPAGGDWSDAAVNEPVAAGSAVRTGKQGRAEITLGGIGLALSPSTEVDIVKLDDDTAQFALKTGHVAVSLDRSNKTSVEVDTDKGGFKGAVPGRYEIDAEAGLVGKAEGAAGARTDPLAGHGEWDGAIWYPKDVAADWVPFRDGSWRYLPPWGWTWIDAASWGFAPSHYGRWARIDGRWGWLPGGAKDFAPATVAFLGTRGIGLSYAGAFGPAVAWFPLAPGEAYWPLDKGDPPAEIVNADYKNRDAASAVPRAVFTGSKPVAGALVEIPERRLAIAPTIPGGPGISPPTPRVAAASPHIAPHVAAAAPKPAAPDPSAHVALASNSKRPRTTAHAATAKHAPHRIALDRRHRRPSHLAAAPPPKPERPRPHLAEARHVLRQ